MILILQNQSNENVIHSVAIWSSLLLKFINDGWSIESNKLKITVFFMMAFESKKKGHR